MGACHGGGPFTSDEIRDLMERDMKPAALRAVIQGLLGHSAPGTPFVPAALAADDPKLNHGVDETGEGTISLGGWFGFSRVRTSSKMRASKS